MFYWENRMAAWCAIAMQSIVVFHETTILNNNRKLLELFLLFTLQERLEDNPQKK